MLNQDADDCITWKHDDAGIYSMKSFVSKAGSLLGTKKEVHNIFNSLWKGVAHPGAKLVVWFAMIGRLKTKDLLHKLHIIQDADLRCVFCNDAVESIDHLFVECYFSWQVWCMCLC